MAKNEESNSDNRVKNGNPVGQKQCRGKCKNVKPLDRFHNNATKKDGKADICKDCQSEFMRDYNARKAVERRQQLTAGDVQLDPKPAPLSSAGKLVKKDLVREKVIPHQEKVKLPSVIHANPPENEALKVGKVNLPDKSIKQEVHAIVKEVAAMPRADRPLHLTDEEKSIVIASLDRHVAVIEKIIEKLSS
jgi:hypothetical protein